METTTVVERLKAAKARVLAGWCKNTMSQRRLVNGEWQDQYCAAGALLEPGSMCILEETEAHRCLRESLPNQPQHVYHAVAMYNDRPDTTLADIEQLYDRAIALAIQAENEK
jgi:hypothetical protein